MPVEIKELVIRVVATPEANSSERHAASAEGRSQQEMDAIVQECVRQVLRILKKTKER